MASISPTRSTKKEEIIISDENSSTMMDVDDETKSKKRLPDDVNEWPSDVQSEILMAVLRRKPIGIDAAFRMIALVNELNSPAPPASNLVATDSSSWPNLQSPRHRSIVAEYEFTPRDVWKYLDSCYDMKALETMEAPHPMSFAGLKAARSDGDGDGGENDEAAAGDDTKDDDDDQKQQHRDICVEFCLLDGEFGSLIQRKFGAVGGGESSSSTISKTPSITPAATPLPPPDSPTPTPPTMKKPKPATTTTSKGRQRVVIDDTESVSSSRSSTPISSSAAASSSTPTPTPPTTRRSGRKGKD